ncbi:MAG: alkaline phosphatase D family protein [Acidobacteria bacterium]|nr:alkaline phosphatase D family protein [Acidobacteriota bacterium]
MHRRDFLRMAVSPWGATLLRSQDRIEPIAIQSGDVTPGRAIVWARGAAPSSMTVRYRTSPSGPARTVRGPALFASSDFTGRVELTGLPHGQRILYEVQIGDAPPLEGHFLTPPNTPSDVRFLWSGDMVGQGWGINPDLGGIRIFDAMRKLEPHFFLHSGDSIYADSPVPAEVKLPDGRIWRNRITKEKSGIAQTLDEFRGCYRYNLLDDNVRRFSSEVAQIWQWDDHEVTNNWSPSKDLSSDNRYQEKNIRVLVDRARKAYLEYAPLRLTRKEPNRIYRRIPYGPLLDVFVLDMRSYRGPNTFNRQEEESRDTAFLGRQQINWLKHDLKSSHAVWKVIAADMPIGLNVPDGKDAQGRAQFEAIANGDGPPLGRELEIAGLLRFLRQHNIRNTVWLTADVHYTAAHYYDPTKARFTDFLPFWEFVSGPLNAGTFGPGVLDDTFGPRVEFAKAPPKGQSNLSPLSGYQFFGDVQINGKSRELTVTLRDLTGASLYAKTLTPEPRG